MHSANHVPGTRQEAEATEISEIVSAQWVLPAWLGDSQQYLITQHGDQGGDGDTQQLLCLWVAAREGGLIIHGDCRTMLGRACPVPHSLFPPPDL